MNPDDTTTLTTQWRLELVQAPVSDIDQAKAFYVDRVGFVADHDHPLRDETRFVQLTPPGPASSIALTTGAHEMRAGSIEDLQFVVDDRDVARAEFVGCGVEVSEFQEFPWGRFLCFTDPDGNGWSVQPPIR